MSGVASAFSTRGSALTRTRPHEEARRGVEDHRRSRLPPRGRRAWAGRLCHSQGRLEGGAPPPGRVSVDDRARGLAHSRSSRGAETRHCGGTSRRSPSWVSPRHWHSRHMPGGPYRGGRPGTLLGETRRWRLPRSATRDSAVVPEILSAADARLGPRPVAGFRRTRSSRGPTRFLRAAECRNATRSCTSSPAAAPAPAAAPRRREREVVQHSDGRYELRGGDGIGVPHRWVWVPNPPTAPPIAVLWRPRCPPLRLDRRAGHAARDRSARPDSRARHRERRSATLRPRAARGPPGAGRSVKWGAGASTKACATVRHALSTGSIHGGIQAARFRLLQRARNGRPARLLQASRLEDIFNALKTGAAKAGLSQDVRIDRSGCLEHCESGPTVVIYPEGVWYHVPTVEDAGEMLESTSSAERSSSGC